MIWWRLYFKSQVQRYKRNRIRETMGSTFQARVTLLDTKSGTTNFKRELTELINCTWMRCAVFLHKRNKKLSMDLTQIFESISSGSSLQKSQKVDLRRITLIASLLLLTSKRFWQSFNSSLKLGVKTPSSSSLILKLRKRKKMRKDPQIPLIKRSNKTSRL